MSLKKAKLSLREHSIQELLLNDDPMSWPCRRFPNGHSEEVLFPSICNIGVKGGGHMAVSYSCS